MSKSQRRRLRALSLWRAVGRALDAPELAQSPDVAIQLDGRVIGANVNRLHPSHLHARS